ncbi:tripartite tricarboxylate transporter TctB family protein [Aliirhizobium smilacinae]|uniref:tripartite tricarboxylate transporter TctB family protein n=1 Tax=Aliirhizobium smilacinae TaxID=1395944 RepID=UPI0015D631D1|nr:tripartite tricarboxylate transporter TctB family protein [Rhizobium smilacinae]
MQPDQTTVEQDASHLPLGIFCIVAGLAALWIAQDYDTGTFISMGPGFFPKAVSGVLILIGILILLLRGRDMPAGASEVRDTPPLLSRLRVIGCVSAAILVFAATLMPLGLPFASFLMVALAGLGHSGSRPLTIVATAAVLAVLSTVLFAGLLGLQIPVLPEVLR